LNELTTLLCGEISSRRRLKAAEAVMSVLEMSRELVTITDQNHIVQVTKSFLLFFIFLIIFLDLYEFY